MDYWKRQSNRGEDKFVISKYRYIECDGNSIVCSASSSTLLLESFLLDRNVIRHLLTSNDNNPNNEKIKIDFLKYNKVK